MSSPTLNYSLKPTKYSDFRADLLHPAYGDLIQITNEDAYEATYLNGKLHGRAISWFESGKIESDTNYHHGRYLGDNCGYYAKDKFRYGIG